MDSQQIKDRFSRLNTHSRGDRRAPHKPLLVMLALQKLSQGKTSLEYAELEPELLKLLKIFAPPVKSRHQPELPYWHLQSDGVWNVHGAENLARQKSGFPQKKALLLSSAGFTKNVADTLVANPGLRHEIISILLDEHFPPSIHEDILAQIGLLDEITIQEQPPDYVQKKRRDPTFRGNVLRAYEYKCAVTSFRAALGGTYFGCEAAHVQWHAYDGPDLVSNGLCLEPTIHKLFDAGAWTLTDDRRILVSTDFTGSDSAVERLREHHGKPLENPLSGEPVVDAAYIKWHREPSLGGVFRLPAMKL